MADVAFTPNLQRHVECPRRDAPGTTVREVLEGVFADNPRLRGYIVDEHGALRRHMTVFVDGRQISDRERLSDRVGPKSEIYVMQALSGGS
jgi:sulfur-carrier protein